MDPVSTNKFTPLLIRDLSELHSLEVISFVQVEVDSRGQIDIPPLGMSSIQELPKLGIEQLYVFVIDKIDNLQAFLNDIKSVLQDDVFIMSSSVSQLILVSEYSPRVRTVYDVRGTRLNNEKEVTTLLKASDASVLFIDSKFDQMELHHYAKLGLRFWVSDNLYASHYSKLNFYKVIHAVMGGYKQTLYSDAVSSITKSSYKPLVIAHRGMPRWHPENTFEGLVSSVDIGADIVELDIHHSNDNQLIVMHDSTTTRTAEKSYEINQTHSSLLTETHLKNSTSKIPLLSSFIKFTKEHNTHLFIELKSDSLLDARLLSHMIHANKVEHSTSIISFIPHQLTEMRNTSIFFPLGYLNDLISTDDELGIQVSNIMEVVSRGRFHYNPYFGKLTKQLCNQLILRAVPIWPWTVDDEVNWQRMIDFHVDGITTNEADRLIDYIRRNYE